MSTRSHLLVLWSVLVCSMSFGSDRVVLAHPDTTTTSVTSTRLVEMFKAERLHWDCKTRVYLVLPTSKTPANEFLLK